MNRSDWTLLALSESPDGKLSPVQVQKTLFLLGQRRRKDVGRGYYVFKPYNYGPFDPNIYSDIRILELEDLVRSVQAEHGSYREYQITPKGRARAGALSKGASKRAREYLAKVTKWAREVPFSHLVRTIYEMYPSMRKHSVFQD